MQANKTISVDKRFINILKKFGYFSLNDIQLKSFEYINNGKSVLIVAPTGFGKTEAALFPIFWKIYSNKKYRGIKCIYITPLRALNRDIFQRMKKISHELEISIVVRHGDTPERQRRKIILEPPDILITTPETLQFLLVGKRIRELLKTVRWVVIDEVHELLESKRGTQLAIALERLEKIATNRIARIALSATIGNEDIAGRYFNRGKMMDIIKSADTKKIEIDVFLEYEETIDEQKQLERRLRRIVDLIEENGNVLIFTNTRDTAELLAMRLKLIAPFDIRVHHGSLSREERISVENSFKKGLIRGVVATSSLELGIDIGLINMIIQYMSPRQVNRLIQRIGRSGHLQEKISRGIIIASDIQEYIESLIIASRALRGNLDRNEPIVQSLDVLAHQIVGLILEYKRIKIEEIYDIITRAYPYHNLSFSKFFNLILFMEKIKLLKIYDDKVLGIGPRSFEYYFSTSMIPDTETFFVIESSTQRRIGNIDFDFAVSNLSEGGYFILGGNIWEIIKIDIEKKIIFVNRGRMKYGIIPSWTGEDLPVPYKVAREVCAFKRRIIRTFFGETTKNILRDYRIIPSFKEFLPLLIKYFSKFKEEVKILINGKNILVELANNIAIINSCLGSKGNEALGILLAYVFSLLYGEMIVYKVDPYNVILLSNRKIDKDKIEKVIDYIINHKNVISILYEAIKKTNLFKWKFVQVAKRMGLISESKSRYILSNISRFFANTPVEDEALNETLHSRFDIRALRYFISSLRSRKKRLVYIIVGKERKSLLGEEVFRRYYKTGFLVNKISLPMVTKIVKKRLLNTKIRFICLHCGKWSSVYKVGEIKINRCPICGSKALGIASLWDEDSVSIVKKWKMNKNKLSREEKEFIKRLQKTAIIFLNYGKKGVMVLAGRGIGPYIALKILRNSRNDEEIIKKIIRAENNYLRTREFWVISKKQK